MSLSGQFLIIVYMIQPEMKLIEGVTLLNECKSKEINLRRGFPQCGIHSQLHYLALLQSFTQVF